MRGDCATTSLRLSCNPSSTCVLLLMTLLGCGLSEPLPAIVCESPIYDLGTTRDARVQHRFEIKNTSNLPVKIARMEKSCTCLTPTLSGSEIPPGGVVWVEMTAEVSPRPPWNRDAFEHSLVVFPETEDQAPVALIIKGLFIPPICFDQDSISIELNDAGDSDVSTSIDLYTVAKGGASLNAAVSGIPWLTAKVNSAPSVDRLGFRANSVSLKGALPEQVGLPLFGTLELTLDGSGVPGTAIPIIVISSVETHVAQLPDRVALGVLTTSQTVEREIVAVWQTAAGFEVEDVVANEPFSCTYSIETEDGTKTTLVIRIKVTAPQSTATLSGEVRALLRNGNRTRTLVWPVSGVVR